MRYSRARGETDGVRRGGAGWEDDGRRAAGGAGWAGRRCMAGGGWWRTASPLLPVRELQARPPSALPN